jgi:hypothetical protein
MKRLSMKVSIKALVEPVIVRTAVLILAGFFLLSTADVAAQASSANYGLTSAAAVAGGGTSGSTNYGTVGAVPLTGGGISISTGYTIGGGVVPGTFVTPGFAVVYDNPSMKTVTKTDQILKVAYAPSGTTSGEFYSRLGGETLYQHAPMTAGTGDTLVYTVNTGLLTVRGLEYYFVITQGSTTVNIGTSADPYVFRVQLTNAQAQRPTPVTSMKYRIVGVPIEISGTSSVTAIFGDDFGAVDKTQWRLWSFNSGTGTAVEYPSAASATPGKGYWLIQRTPKSYGATGFSRLPNRDDGGNAYYQINLDSGWNLVGNPLAFDVAWNDVRLDTGGVVIGHSTSVVDNVAYYYDGPPYIHATNIPAWDGFFVFVKRPGVKMLFPYEETTKSSLKPLNQLAKSWSAEDWSLDLRLEANGMIDDGNFAGVLPDAKVGSDDYDMSEPPPAPDGAYLAFRLPENEFSRLRRSDFRPPFADGAEWTFEVSRGTGRSVVVSGINRLPGGMRAVMVLSDGGVAELSENSRIELSDGVVSGRLIIGTEFYLTGTIGDILPKQFALDQNYPNPFNPATTIKFALPSPQHVTLTIFNILGQTVRTIVDDDLQAGQYVRTWNGDDHQGQPVASGIYFYRLDAGEFSRCRKMMLLK